VTVQTPQSIEVSAVYGWFTEGFGTDLKDAKALLEKLAR
jgi:hypothetical protein